MNYDSREKKPAELNRKKIIDAEDKASNTENLKYQQVMESGEISMKDYVDTELSKKYSEFYNPFGDYLRIVLQNRMYNVRGAKNIKFDFGADKSNLISVLGKKNFLMRESPRRGDSATYVFMETGSAPYRLEKKNSFTSCLVFTAATHLVACFMHQLHFPNYITVMTMIVLFRLSQVMLANQFEWKSWLIWTRLFPLNLKLIFLQKWQKLWFKPSWQLLHKQRLKQLPKISRMIVSR